MIVLIIFLVRLSFSSVSLQVFLSQSHGMYHAEPQYHVTFRSHRLFHVHDGEGMCGCFQCRLSEFLQIITSIGYQSQMTFALVAENEECRLDGQWCSLYDIFLCRTVDGKLRQLRNVKSLLVQIFFQAVGQEVFQMLLLWLVEDTYLHLIIALLKS